MGARLPVPLDRTICIDAHTNSIHAEAHEDAPSREPPGSRAAPGRGRGTAGAYDADWVATGVLRQAQYGVVSRASMRMAPSRVADRSRQTCRGPWTTLLIDRQPPTTPYLSLRSRRRAAISHQRRPRAASGAIPSPRAHATHLPARRGPQASVQQSCRQPNPPGALSAPRHTRRAALQLRYQLVIRRPLLSPEA